MARPTGGGNHSSDAWKKKKKNTDAKTQTQTAPTQTEVHAAFQRLRTQAMKILLAKIGGQFEEDEY